MRKINIKEIWKKHKKKIIAVGATAAGCLAVYQITKHGKIVIEGIQVDFKDFVDGVCVKNDGINIPEMDDMRCLDIAKDVNNGKVVWLEDCKLSQMGKLGENLTKIEGVDPNMVTTMVILETDNIKTN